MTAPDDDDTPATPHRPPAPPRQWATVTRLGDRSTTGPRPGTAREPAVQGSLALARPGETAASGPPTTPELRVVSGGGAGGPSHADVQAWAARFSQAVVEVLGGDRPLTQLVRWTSQRVYAELERRMALLAHTSDAGRRLRTVRPQVRSVHVCRPTETVAEVSVHVRHGSRSRAIAARLELVCGRWQCTALQLG